jgi:hypothetical protein
MASHALRSVYTRRVSQPMDLVIGSILERCAHVRCCWDIYVVRTVFICYLNLFGSGSHKVLYALVNSRRTSSAYFSTTTCRDVTSQNSSDLDTRGGSPKLKSEVRRVLRGYISSCRDNLCFVRDRGEIQRFLHFMRDWESPTHFCRRLSIVRRQPSPTL